MTGKEKCDLLKQIRKEIADKNGIAFEPAKCTLTNPLCIGTCPRCDAEIEYLDAELNRKVQMGEKITVAGVSPKVLNQEAGTYRPLFGQKPEIPNFIPERRADGFKTEVPDPVNRDSWPIGSRGNSNGVYQTMGIIRMPESISPKELDEYWDDEEQDDKD